MVDLQSILAEHRSKSKVTNSHEKGGSGPHDPSASEIPDIFFGSRQYPASEAAY